MRECTYHTHRCEMCSRIGHKEGNCKTAARRTPNTRFTQHVRTQMISVNVRNVQQRRKFVTVVINGTPIQLQLDTASDITMIDRKTWQHVGSPKLIPSPMITHTASGANLTLDGYFMGSVSVADQTKIVQIFVTSACLLLLGLDLIDIFSLWSSPIDTFCCQPEDVCTTNFGNIDPPSRLKHTHAKPAKNCVIASSETDVKSIMVNTQEIMLINFAEVTRETDKDPLLQMVEHYIRKGWPENRTYTGELARYYDRKDRLSIGGGCLLFSGRVVVPRALQQRCLQQLHNAHSDIINIKALARSYFYWPSRDVDIDNWVFTPAILVQF